MSANQTSLDQVVDERLFTIANELFGPSRATLSAVALGGEKILNSLPAKMKEILKEDEFSLQIEILRDSLDDFGDCDLTPLLEGRPSRVTPFERGQIRIVEGVDLNDPTSAQRYTEPVLVLLDRPVERHPDSPKVEETVWQGWTISPYAGFAGYWDVLLQGEDVPNPCAMVQVWNFVQVTEAQMGLKRYSLSAQQQADVDAVWREFMSGEQEPAQESATDRQWMTAGMRVTFHGVEVVTGSPSFDDDPRFMLQRFYVQVRDALNEATQRFIDAHKVYLEWFGTFHHLSLISNENGDLINQTPDLRLRKDDEEALARGSRYAAGVPLKDQTESSWIPWGGYASKSKRLKLDLIKDLAERLPKGALRFEYYVAVPKVRNPDAKPTKDIEYDLISVEHEPVDEKGRVFLLKSNVGRVNLVLAGKVALDIEPPTYVSPHYVVKVVIRAA